MATKRILIIDDASEFTQLVKLNLELTGRFEVGVVNQPLEAVATAQAVKPHLILLDVMMPSKSGGELLAELESDAQLKNVPVLFKRPIAWWESLIFKARSSPSSTCAGDFGCRSGNRNSQTTSFSRGRRGSGWR